MSGKRKIDGKGTNPEKDRKGGKYYEKHLIYMTTGLRGERNRVRMIDATNWRQYKKILDPEGVSQLHHGWHKDSAQYDYVAIVDTTFTHIHENCEVMLDGPIIIGGKERVCELCGEKGYTHWHHPDGRVSVIAMFACLEVCPKCHKQVEHMTVDQVLAYARGIEREKRNG